MTELYRKVLSVFFGFAFLALPRMGFSQTIMVNKADTISIVGTDFISVIGGIWNDSAGAWYNEGTLFFTDSLINDGQNTMFHASWTGMTDMRGANQVIAGNSVTRFYDLRQTNTGIKRLAINAEVEDSLILNHLEFATDSFSVYCQNPDPGIVTRTSGFVSSLDTGYIWRSTNSNSPYLFPTGSSLGTPRYRPMEISPNAPAASAFSARMANVDATNENYDRNIHDTLVCQINPLFYHRVRQHGANLQADLALYYDDAADGYFDGIAHWQNAPRWELLVPSTLNLLTSPLLSSVTHFSVSLWPLPPFALADRVPYVSLTSNEDSLCFGDSIVFTATPGDYPNYTFLNNGTDTLQSGPDSTLAFAQMPAGLNAVTVVANTGICQYTSNAVQVLVNQPFVIDAGRDTFLCYNVSFTLGGNPSLSGGLAPYTYQWLPTTGLSNPNVANPTLNVSVSTVFVMTIGDAFGCLLSDSVSLNVNPEILADAGNDTTMCLSDSITLGGNPSGSGGTGALSWSWNPNHALSSTSAANPYAFPGSSITYYLTVNDPTGCSRMDTIIVTVDTLRPSGIILSGAPQFCDYDSLTLTAYPAGGSFLWSTGETTPSISISQSGNYTVQVSQYCGTTASAPVTISIWASPVANFSADPLSANVDEEIHFTDLSTGHIATWNWDFGDLFMSTHQNPTHAYDDAGIFTITLVVTSPEGCTDTMTIERYLEIILNSTIFFPNAFTPNDDGLNDNFGPAGVNIVEFQIEHF